MNGEDESVDLLALERRAKGIRDWLERNGRECFVEQKHVRSSSQERIYWHYGYMVALMDALAYITNGMLFSDHQCSEAEDKCMSSTLGRLDG